MAAREERVRGPRFRAEIAISRASANRFFSARKNRDGRALVNRRLSQGTGVTMANPLLFSLNEISRRKKPFISDHRPTFNDDDDDDDETLTIEGEGDFRAADSRVSRTSFESKG